jgi:phosphinothricin acetyltransferase
MTHVMAIYNLYVQKYYAAYSEKELGIDFFERLRRESISFYVLEVKKQVVGFGLLRNYLPYDNFKHSGLLTYFILPEYTNKGYGTLFIDQLISDAKGNDIQTIVVHISSLNNQSIKFHQKHGFVECGRLRSVGKKFNRYFDIVWMQSDLGVNHQD